MPKKREKSSDEFYKGQLRELQAENKSLKKRIKQLERREHFADVEQYEDVELPVGEQNAVLEKRIRCDDAGCGKGTYDTIELLGKLYGKCNICGNQKRLK